MNLIFWTQFVWQKILIWLIFCKIFHIASGSHFFFWYKETFYKRPLCIAVVSICIVFLTIVSSLDIMQRAFEFYVMHWKAKHAVVHLLSKQLQAMLHCKIIHVKALEKQPLPSLQCIFSLVYSFFLRQKIAEIGKICKAFFGKSIP